ncbi:MAG TPA: AMP-binding protein [Candidatus Elarobacter sp.]|nr:AMP-binding protein [Candidatus Elarobacter sp.]
MNVVEILRARAAAHPQRIALIDAAAQRTLTYAELDEASTHVAASVRGRGLRAGETVLLLHPVGIELYAALIGLLRAGLIPAIPPPGATRASLRHCARTHAPRAVLVGGIGWLALAAVPSLRHAVRLSTTLAPLAHDVLHDAALDANGAVEPCGDAAPAMLTFTSGSTGAPKALVRTHGVAHTQVNALSDALGLDGATSLCTMPMVLLAELAAGATCVLSGVDLRHPGRADAAALAAVLRDYGVARIVASPALLGNLALALRRAHATLPALRLIASGGAPVMPPLARALRAVAPNARLLAVYGSTEAEPIALLDAADVAPSDHAAMRAGAGLLAGVPCAPGSVAIVPARRGAVFGPFPHDDDVERRTLGAGEAGEIVVSGPHVVPHYTDAAADATTKIRAGARTWHRTGDLGYYDARGRLWLVGRAAATIDDAHGTLEPLRVECALAYVPGVARSAVAGADGVRVLVVEPLAGHPLDERAVRDALEFARIDRIIVAPVPVDPRHDAKVDYAALERIVRRGARAA